MPKMPQKEISPDPKIILQTAIADLDLFTQSESARLEVGENGHLIATQESRLERVVGLARCFIVPFFSDQVKQEQENRLLEVKKAILQAREMIQSHSALIERFKEGDEGQRKLAESALSTIQRYNAIVGSNGPNKDFYNYERTQLLLDQEIKGQQIELPRAISVKHDSPSDNHLAHQLFKKLSQVFSQGAAEKTNTICPTYKKSMQFMIDTFHVKTMRMIMETDLERIVPLIKQTPLDIDEVSNPDLISMQQFIVEPDSMIWIKGCFNRKNSHSKFMTFPILESLSIHSYKISLSFSRHWKS